MLAFDMKLQGSFISQRIVSFGKAVAEEDGDWVVKGFIDIWKNIYSISVDTKVVSKILELLLFPELVHFAKDNGFTLYLTEHQNHYPDVSLVHNESGTMFALDIKSTYRVTAAEVNGMTLGAFTGYFRERKSIKNTRFPYSSYRGHFVLGIIYSKRDGVADERKSYKLDQLAEIPSVIGDFHFFVQPKWRIAIDRPGSGNTKNIGSTTNISDLIAGNGPFYALGEHVFDDFWMHYMTKDMALAAQAGTPPYNNLVSYRRYKAVGSK
jgi:hypothetical protein